MIRNDWSALADAGNLSIHSEKQSRSWLCLTGGAILGGKFCQGGQTTSPIWGSFTRYVMPLTGREDTLICTILFHSYGRQCYEALEREGSQSVKLELRKEWIQYSIENQIGRQTADYRFFIRKRFIRNYCSTAQKVKKVQYWIFESKESW